MAKEGERISRALALAVVAMGAPGAAAADEGGWYGRVDGGYSFDASLDLNAGAGITGEPSADEGGFVSLGLGYELNEHWRFEAELASRDKDVSPDQGIDQGGSFSAATLMVNAFYDLAPGASIEPYVGAGIGVASSEIDLSNTAPLNPVTIVDESTSVAYQVILGLAIPIGRELKFDLGYRYLGGISVDGEGSAPPVISFPFDASLADHAVTLGLRWDF